MGSSNKWRIDVAVTDAHTVKCVLESGRELDPSKSTKPTWDEFAFRKWSEHTKWDPCDLLLLLSKQYPNLIFSAQYSGDYGTGKIFFFNGEDIEACEIWVPPAFPMLPLLKKALAAKKKRQAAQMVQLQKEAAEKAAAADRARIKALEDELKTLKKKQLPPMDIAPQRQ